MKYSLTVVPRAEKGPNTLRQYIWSGAGRVKSTVHFPRVKQWTEIESIYVPLRVTDNVLDGASGSSPLPCHTLGSEDLEPMAQYSSRQCPQL